MSNSDGKRSILGGILREIRIEDVMIKPAPSINENDNFSLAQEKFVENHLTHICVVDDRGGLVGIISQKYLYKAQSPRKVLDEEIECDPELIIDGDSFYSKEILDSYILSKIMNHKPFILNSQDSLGGAVVLMAKNHLGCIPIVDDQKKLLGVLTDQMIIKFLAGQM